MKTVLVIDDDPLVANTISKVLTRAGYKVKVAPDGKAGIVQFCAEQTDMVITDLSPAIWRQRASPRSFLSEELGVTGDRWNPSSRG